MDVAEYTSDICHIAGAATVVADTLSRPPGHTAAERPPSAATCVKAPSGSQVVALQGGKLNSSPPSLPGVVASVADVQPGDWHVLPQDRCFYSQLKDALRACGAGPGHSHLPWVLLGLSAAPKEDSAVFQQSWLLGHHWYCQDSS